MKVSVIIPTLNEASNIEACIQSVWAQSYPDTEILVVDGQSIDRTRDIAHLAGAIVIDNPARVQDVGKMIGVRASTGDIVLMMDADNRLVGRGYISRALLHLTLNPSAIGVESQYWRNPDMTSWNVYLTELLHISDPVSWLISSPPRGHEFCILTGAWPLGANGFFFRRKDLEDARVLREERFEDCSAALMVAEHLESSLWLRILGCGVEHYHSRGPRDFIQKRKRQTVHYLKYRRGLQLRNKYCWMRKQRVSKPVAILYCLSVIGPLITMAWKICKTHRWEWLWHPIACLCSVYGLVLGIRAYAKATSAQEPLGVPGATDAWEASLQPARE